MLEFKRYRTRDMKQAYDAAIRELGSDVIMTNKIKVRKKGFLGWFKKRDLEVTFCYDSEKTPAALKKNSASKRNTLPILNTLNIQNPENYPVTDISTLQGLYTGAQPGIGGMPADPAVQSFNEHIEQRMDVFEQTVDKLQEFMDKFDIVKRDITYDYPDDIQELLGKMIDAQVREELAHSLAQQTDKLSRNKPGAAASEILEHLLHEQFGTAEPIVHKKFTQKVILVLGPTGVGKTTTIVKLAAEFKIKQRKNVGIINTDSYRIGAQEQLDAYAEILSVPIERVYEPEKIESTMEQLSDRDIIFVDTAGKRPGDEEYKKELLELIKVLKPEEILLCLAATTSFASIKEMVDTYGFIDDYKLLITKLDEARYRGSLLNISWYTRKPLAYVTTGQEVPKDIEVANVDKLVKEIIYGVDFEGKK